MSGRRAVPKKKTSDDEQQFLSGIRRLRALDPAGRRAAYSRYERIKSDLPEAFSMALARYLWLIH